MINNSYLIVTIDSVKYALHAKNVLSILELSHITKVPHAPYYMHGIINLRGKVLAVIDARLKLGLSKTTITPNTCIIVTIFDVGEESVELGIMVDFVNMVEEIFEENIGSPPAIGNQYKSSFILGVSRVNDDFVMIVDLAQLFAPSDLIELKKPENFVEP